MAIDSDGGGVRVNMDADTGVLSVPGVRPLVYHCRVLSATDGAPCRVSVIVFDACGLDSREALGVDPLPAHVTGDGLVSVPAFGLGSEPLHVVAFSSDRDTPGCYATEAVCVCERPLAGDTVDLGGVARLRVLRVEPLLPLAYNAASLCAMADACGLELVPVEPSAAADALPATPSVPRPVPCAAFHVHGQRPLESAEGVRTLLAAWTVHLNATCVNEDLRAAIGALLPRAARLAEPFVSRVGVSRTLVEGGIPPPPARASAGRCMISQRHACELGDPDWSLCLVNGRRSDSGRGDFFAYVSKGPLVMVIDTRLPARFPLSLYGSDLPPAWLSRHDADAYKRACTWHRAALFHCSVASISASLAASTR